MAFDYIYKMVDELEKEHQYNVQKADESYGVDPARARMHSSRADGIFQALVIFYNTVLQTGKFKSQREYGKTAIFRIKPAFAEGFFNHPWMPDDDQKRRSRLSGGF